MEEGVPLFGSSEWNLEGPISSEGTPVSLGAPELGKESASSFLTDRPL